MGHGAAAVEFPQKWTFGASEHTACSTYEATNTIRDPEFIHPIESTVKFSAETWKHAVPALAIEVIDIPLE